MSDLEVWLDVDFLDEMVRVGTLAHDKGQVRFKYDKEWLKHSLSFALDPHLTLDAAPFFPNPTTGNFGIFLDSSPDRWGQTLMQRREVIEARDEGRKPRTLYAWNYLIGVQDLTRQGALRFRLEGKTPFLADNALSAPPVTRLGELEAVAKELTSKKINDLDALKLQLDRTPGNKTSALEVTGKVEVETRHANPVETRQLPELRMSPELRAKLDAVLGPAPEPPARQLPVPERSLGLDL